jgi:hypothetical protein
VVFVISHVLRPAMNVIAYLEQAVDYLTAHIFLVGREELALEETEDAFGDTVVGLQVFGCAGSIILRAHVKRGAVHL